VVLLAAPFFLEAFWLRGLRGLRAIIGAIGLNLLVGTTGSCPGPRFFLAVGASPTLRVG
jgi:hypothetical protein